MTLGRVVYVALRKVASSLPRVRYATLGFE